jgi:hypothetical protein
VLFVCCADLCEVESDITPLRWRVAKVMHRTLGVASADLPLETRFMVGPWAWACSAFKVTTSLSCTAPACWLPAPAWLVCSQCIQLIMAVNVLIERLQCSSALA